MCPGETPRVGTVQCTGNLSEQEGEEDFMTDHMVMIIHLE